MGFRTLLFAVLLLAAACGDDAASTTTASTTTTAPGLTTPGTIGVVASGIRWELPATACDLAPGDGAATAAKALEAATEVQDLVAQRVSGWPTTTMAPPGTNAAFFVAVNRSGPTALALGTLAGTAEAIEAAWATFEQGYAANGWGPVTDISVRLAGWHTTAAAIVAVVPEACG